MSLNITRGVMFKAQKILLYGPEGIGKSTFASQFPDPLFIDTEGSTNTMDVKRVPKPSSWTMMLQQINEIKNTPGICKTLVIDTIDWAEQLCVNHVCAVHKVDGIEGFNYGKGYVYVKEEFGRLLNLLIDVTDIGINVVLTAHSTIRKFELPDECGSFDRYELKLGNKTGSQVSSLVKEWADMMLFANYKQYVVEVNKKKKVQGGTRVMYTQHHACWDAKNRHGLAEELPFEYIQIAHCIPNNNTDTEKQPENMPKDMPPDNNSPKTKPQEKPAEIKQKPAEKPVKDTPPEEEKQQDDLTGVPPKLADLMKSNNVTIKELQDVVTARGYYPAGTPIANYDNDFIEGCLIGAWTQVFDMIEAERLPFK